jgi:hypothetical protein
MRFVGCGHLFGRTAGPETRIARLIPPQGRTRLVPLGRVRPAPAPSVVFHRRGRHISSHAVPAELFESASLMTFFESGRSALPDRPSAWT